MRKIKEVLRLRFEGADAPAPMEFKYVVNGEALKLENAQKTVVEFTKLKSDPS